MNTAVVMDMIRQDQLRRLTIHAQGGRAVLTATGDIYFATVPSEPYKPAPVHDLPPTGHRPAIGQGEGTEQDRGP